MKHIAVALALLLNQGIASAMCIWMTLERQFQRAEEVLIARVTATTKEDAGRYGAKYVAKYVVLESFKQSGANRDDAYSTSEVHDIALSPGRTYLFFIQKNRHVGLCGGSRTWQWDSPEPDEKAVETLDQLRRLRDNGASQEAP